MTKISSGRIILIIFSLLFVATIVRGFYVFYYTKNYDYLIEASCDSATETCFQRNCADDPDNCPPNNLDTYKQFYIKAYDFERCKYNSCKLLCAREPNTCSEVKCGDSPDDVCARIPEQGTASSSESSP